MAKIIVSAYDANADGQVCPTFGRCPGFLLVEEENGSVKSKEFKQNVNMGAIRGAGIAAAQLIASSGAKIVITGNVGPNAFSVLNSAGIKVLRASGSINDAVARFAKGELEEMTGPGPIGFGRGMGGGRGRGGPGRGRAWQQ